MRIEIHESVLKLKLKLKKNLITRIEIKKKIISVHIAYLLGTKKNAIE